MAAALTMKVGEQSITLSLEASTIASFSIKKLQAVVSNVLSVLPKRQKAKPARFKTTRPPQRGWFGRVTLMVVPTRASIVRRIYSERPEPRKANEESLGLGYLGTTPRRGVMLDGHPVPPREKGLSLPAMCRGQTQVGAGSGARVSLIHFRARVAPRRVGRGGKWV